MAQSRLDLHELLVELADGNKVYFQPPNNYKIEYPCVVYKRDFAKTDFAGNSPYRNTKRYMVTVIDRDPDSSIPDKVAALPLCTHVRFYTVDNLNHDVFNVFF